MWKLIPNYAGMYRVSDAGEIQSKKTPGRVGKWTPVKGRVNGDGYIQIALSRSGTVRQPFLHSLVLTLFVGPCPPGKECRHLDGNIRNNRLSNLEWGTRQQNIDDKLGHGTNHCPRSREGNLTREDVSEIIQLRGELSAREVAGVYGVSRQTINRTWNGKRKRDGKQT